MSIPPQQFVNRVRRYRHLYRKLEKKRRAMIVCLIVWAITSLVKGKGLRRRVVPVAVAAAACV